MPTGHTWPSAESHHTRNWLWQHDSTFDRTYKWGDYRDAGEQFAINYERARLISLGKESLADKIEHVAKTQGDGAGFDIRSFEADGTDRFIEVKTTRYGKYSPFFISANELSFSEKHEKNYHLHRIFQFRDDPRLFSLPGSVKKNFVLSPTEYRASLS